MQHHFKNLKIWQLIQQKRQCSIISQSAWFDHRYYQQTYPELSGNRDELVLHFYTIGCKNGYRPCRIFDPSFYLNKYKDVQESNINPLVHWITNGYNEGRYSCVEFYEIGLIEKSKLFDYEYYSEQIRHTQVTVPLIEHYYFTGEKLGLRPSKEFDSEFYRLTNPDVANNTSNLFLHWILYGRNENRFKNINEHQIHLIEESHLFDSQYYLLNNPDIAKTGISPAYHYYYFGWRENRNPSIHFNTQFYLQNNPSISQTGINPLVHFILAGKNEGLKTKDISADYTIIKESGYFNRQFYLKKYPDIANSGIDPLQHFVDTGWLEKRKPAAWFNSHFYVAQYQDVAQAQKNPLIHFIQNGKEEQRRTNLFINLEKFELSDTQPVIDNTTVIDIIVPIYNGLSYLQRLLPQIIERTKGLYNLILINDASPDSAIAPFLESFAKDKKNVNIITNKTNLGFVRSVNIGLLKATNHVVILNTDVEIPFGWLERLIAPILNDSRIASVTPMTNAGTIASFPYINTDNKNFMDLDVDVIDNQFIKYGYKDYIAVPTGVGFCMAMNRLVIDRIGNLDEKTFARGYGEENDWCCRAIKEGYINIITPNLYVWHKHGGSFQSNEKKHLIQQNSALLQKKHPEYWPNVCKYLLSDPIAPYRLHALLSIASEKAKQKVWIIIDHQLGGGTNIYGQKLIAEKQQIQPVVCISYSHVEDAYNLNIQFINHKADALFETLEEILDFLSSLEIETVFYNSVVSFPAPLKILELLSHFVQNKKIEAIIPIHDYYSICQSFTLLNDKMEFCGASTDNRECIRCIKNNNRYEFKEFGIIEWRQAWRNTLELSTKIIVFSNSSKKLLLKIYPEVDSKKIEVTPHQLPHLLGKKPTILPQQELHIGVVGSINSHKGSEVVVKIAAALETLGWGKITVIGTLIDNVCTIDRLSVTGRYQPQDLALIIEKQKINVALFPSIWPETFSYVTQELMALGMPLAVFNIGAPAERVAQYKKGALLPLNANVFDIIETLDILYNKKVSNPDINCFKQINAEKLFDETFYTRQYSDVVSSGLDPLLHYIRYGGSEGRRPSLLFDSQFYLESNPDVKESGVNPLLHYVKHGKAEKRPAVRQLDNFMFSTTVSLRKNIKVAALIHAYYEDLIIELLNDTCSIPTPYTVLISIVSAKGKAIVEDWKTQHPSVQIICKLVENKGRDIAPAFVAFREEILQFEYVCKIHTKKSLYTGAEQSGWRRELITNILGNEQHVSNILNAFETNKKIGLIYPFSDLLPYWAYTWLSNKNIGYALQNKLELPLTINGYVDYPMGSMLWFRPEALAQLLDGRIKQTDFPDEPCGNDGTFAHAIERAFVDIAKHNGFTLMELNFYHQVFAQGQGYRNMPQYANKSYNSLIDKIDNHLVISFDIFDTLIARPFCQPDDLFILLEREIDARFSTKSNFLSIRRQSEQLARKAKQSDVTYHEIYNAMGNNALLPQDIVSYASEREFDLELRFSLPKPELIKAFNYAIANGKKVILVSDMYLDEQQLAKMLAKHNITDYWKMYVSSVVGARKDTGTMWNYLLLNEITIKEQFLHIGDNEHSDIQQTVDRGLHYYHVMSAHNMFLNSQLGIAFTNKYGQAWKEKLYLGIIIERLFETPFIGKHQRFLDIHSRSPFMTGYVAFGPLLMYYCNWLAQQMKMQNCSKAFFLAREGYFLKKVYDLYRTLPAVLQTYGELPSSEYLLVSRRALMGAVPKTIENIKELLLNNHFHGTLQNLLYYRFGIDLKTIIPEKANISIHLPADIDQVMVVVTKILPHFDARAKTESDALQLYLKQCQFIGATSPALIDVGYSATIQKLLFRQTKQNMAGYYFISRDTVKQWTSPQNIVKGCFEEGAKQNSQTPIFKFNLYLEAWLTAPDGQLAYYQIEKNKANPVFHEKEWVKQLFHINEEIGKGALAFMRDAAALCVSSVDELGLDSESTQIIFEQFVHKDLWDNDLRRIAYLEDHFCGTESQDVIGDYKKYVL